MSFTSIIKAAERAQPQFSPVRGNAADNRDVLKEMALDMMRALTALVEEAGGDASYIEPYTESLVDDLNYAFADLVERGSDWRGHNSEARLAHRMEIVRGATLLAAE